MSSWDRLKAAQHDAWALVDRAVTEDEQSKDSEKRQALPFYKSGLAALQNALTIDVSDICDESAKQRAVKLTSKIRKNIVYVQDRIKVLEGLPQRPMSRKPRAVVGTNKGSTKVTAVNTQDKPVLKNIDKNLAEAILSEIVDSAGTGPSLDDVVGLQEAKAAMHEAVVLPALRPDLFTGLRIPPKGVLLFGPPGNGKTLLAKAIANQAKATFFSVSASSLISKWMGESEKLIRALFSAARQLQPSIIFLDECDSILSERRSGENDSTRRVKTEFLVQCDGLSSATENERVVLLAATNRPWDLDSAALRRLPRRIYLPLPNHEIRKSILRHWFEKNSKEAKLSPIEIETLAVETEGYSAADMAQLLRDAALEPLRELPVETQCSIAKSAIRPVNVTDLRNSTRKIRPSFHDTSLLRKYLNWNNEYGSCD